MEFTHKIIMRKNYFWKTLMRIFIIFISSLLTKSSRILPGFRSNYAYATTLVQNPGYTYIQRIPRSCVRNIRFGSRKFRHEIINLASSSRTQHITPDLCKYTNHCEDASLLGRENHELIQNTVKKIYK